VQNHSNVRDLNNKRLMRETVVRWFDNVGNFKYYHEQKLEIEQIEKWLRIWKVYYNQTLRYLFFTDWLGGSLSYPSAYHADHPTGLAGGIFLPANAGWKKGERFPDDQVQNHGDRSPTKR